MTGSGFKTPSASFLERGGRANKPCARNRTKKAPWMPLDYFLKILIFYLWQQ